MTAVILEDGRTDGLIISFFVLFSNEGCGCDAMVGGVELLCGTVGRTQFCCLVAREIRSGESRGKREP